MNEEFCVIVYQDEHGVAMARRIDMTELGMCKPASVLMPSDPTTAKPFSFETPITCYVAYYNSDRVGASVPFEKIHLEVTDDVPLESIWQLLAGIGQDERKIAELYQDLCNIVNALEIGDKRQKYTKSD